MTAAPSGRPILIADADEQFRRRVSTLLHGAGFATLSMSSGDEVLATASKEAPAAVILDVSLPGLNGYEVCRQLRDTYGDSIPVVFVSGERTEAYDRVAGLLIGADDYIVKPFDPAELIARVRRLVRRGTPRVEPALRRVELDALTKREREVLGLLSEGYVQSEIARKLVISPKTVSTHIQHVLEKLQVHDRTQAVALALRAPGPHPQTSLG